MKLTTLLLIILLLSNIFIRSFQSEFESNINSIFSIEYSENTSQVLVNQNSLFKNSGFFLVNNNILFSSLSVDSKIKVISYNGLNVSDVFTSENSIISHNIGLKVHLGFIVISENEIIILDHKEFASNLILINSNFKKINLNGTFENSSLSSFSGKAVSKKEEANTSSFYHCQLLDAIYVKSSTSINYLIVLTLDRRRRTSNNML